MSIQDGLKAFSPAGVAIRGTFEVSSDCLPVESFVLKNGKVSVEEWSSSGSNRPDSDCVLLNGKAVYQDVNGELWPADSLTLKDEDGEVVHVGKHMLPLPRPDETAAFTTALLVEMLAGREFEQAPAWTETANEQGWSDASKLQHMTDFLRDAGLLQAFSGYAAEQADCQQALADDLQAPKINKRAPR